MSVKLLVSNYIESIKGVDGSGIATIANGFPVTGTVNLSAASVAISNTNPLPVTEGFTKNEVFTNTGAILTATASSFTPTITCVKARVKNTSTYSLQLTCKTTQATGGNTTYLPLDSSSIPNDWFDIPMRLSSLTVNNATASTVAASSFWVEFIGH